MAERALLASEEEAASTVRAIGEAALATRPIHNVMALLAPAYHRFDPPDGAKLQSAPPRNYHHTTSLDDSNPAESVQRRLRRITPQGRNV